MVNEVQSKHLHFPLGKISIHIDSPRFPLCGQSNHHSFWCHMPFRLCFFCLPNSLILSFWICVSQKSQKNLQIQAMEKLRSHIVSKGWANDCCALPFHDQTIVAIKIKHQNWSNWAKFPIRAILMRLELVIWCDYLLAASKQVYINSGLKNSILSE